MELSNRLEAITGLTNGGNTVCDVGCDHGYVSIYLTKNKKFTHAIAMDINEGPLLNAVSNIKHEGLIGKIETRLSDGLSKLEINEADLIIIAGMGGPLIVNIIKNRLEVAKSAGELILQPQSDIPSVRIFLRNNGFYIDREDMILEDNKFYPMFHVIVSEKNYCNDNDSDLYDIYGEHLLKTKNSVLREYLIKEKDNYKAIKERLSLDKKCNAKSRIEEIEMILENNMRAFNFWGEQ